MKHTKIIEELVEDCIGYCDKVVDGEILPRFSSERYAENVVAYGTTLFDLYHATINHENGDTFYTYEKNGDVYQVECEYPGDDDALLYVWNRANFTNQITAKQAVVALAMSQDLYQEAVGFGEYRKDEAMLPILRLAASDKMRKLAKKTLESRHVFHSSKLSQLYFMFPEWK